MAPTPSVLDRRRAVYGPNAALSFDAPIEMVRGEGAALFDERGRRYLDCVNNVAHVGHANPAVVEALCSQLRLLNTNSRYLSEGLVELSQQLVDLLPPSLEVVYLVNSGSEANDLALRISRAAAAAAGRRAATHCAVVGGAYHGHLTTTMAMSPYKFWGQGGAGRESWIHVLPCPDPYRGLHLDGRAAARGAAAEARAEGGEVCAFICESVLSCGGQVFLPDGYLAAVYEEMRAAGAVCIADEVQCGFGRVGDAFWGFELSGVVPDVVVLGKPIGNGFPLAAVVTTRALAASFSQQEYFNTYGGNNAATAAGLAVLSELRRLRLQAGAAAVGARLVEGLRALQARHPGVIGDVRGRGLFIGIDIIRDPATKQPAPATAKWLKESAKERFVLLTTDGPYEQVIKIKPPMVFSPADADLLLSTLGSLLDCLAASPEIRAALAAAEEKRAAEMVAPVAARYADNAARIYAYAAAADAAAAAAAPAGGKGAAKAGGGSAASSAGSDCASPAAAGAAGAAGGGRKAASGGSKKAGGGGGGGAAALLRRVWSYASFRSEGSSMSTGGDWEAPRAAP